MTANELQTEFQARAVPYSGGLLLLNPEDAVSLIRRAAESRIAVLGVDGLIVGPDRTVSPLEHIVDFSAGTGCADSCWAEAERFVSERHELGLVFEITLGRHLGGAT